MTGVSKILVVSGLALVAVGVFWELVGKKLGLGRLPGDVVVERPGFRLYFPWVTSLLLSLGLSALLILVQWLRRKP